eukprot:GEMP01083206.1.p1 GENE.GEMP01083206.1~~GEMP01083206.1.p1  ORF type:complete len:113 (+),score=27.28 GEMP01083206.1:382-720(+)
MAAKMLSLEPGFGHHNPSPPDDDPDQIYFSDFGDRKLHGNKWTPGKAEDAFNENAHQLAFRAQQSAKVADNALREALRAEQWARYELHGNEAHLDLLQGNPAHSDFMFGIQQ